ncbi:glycoside hydrolase domain-containing protein [Phocaeicola plebeius]|uniref:DUF4091 domain-containing protein n=1 Tax=Phocaeicola plebeius TaxID=310297 RepID=UPI003AF0EED9
MKKMLFLSALLACGPACFSQQAEKFPLGDYVELTDTKPHDGDEVWSKMTAPVRFCWGTTDVRYKKLNVPNVKATGTLRLKAWKGERVNAQAVLWTQKELEGAEIAVSELKNGSSVIPASAVNTYFVRYVMTDELNKDGSGGCGPRENKAEWDSSMVADVLDIVRVREVQARSTQPVWLNVWVPADACPGKYKGTLTVSGKNFEAMKLPFEIEVVNRTLPEPQKWAFHLDLWQNPYAVARYYQVPLWSKEHFDAMRPIMKMLANVGQRAITASIMHKPWAGQTEDHYDSMIFRMKKLDGTWVYDYTVFDKWVEFMMNEVGIKDLISCYTMIPWALSFDYFDQATNRVQFIKAAPGEEAYAEYWGTFLKDFSRHLREKGWFEKTAISMDERPMEAMREAIKVIKAADPEFKITLAGNYHEEIQGDLYYLSIPYGNQFPEEVKAERERKGQISTVYTCCTEAFPNTFTFSEPAEAVWTVLHAVAGGYDGYLRWAVNSWPMDPLRDSRFRTWAAGDTYSIYPGPRSSIRFERLVEGLQDCEIIHILREELAAKGANGKLKKLNVKLSEFTPEGWMKTNKKSPALMVSELNALLNEM